MVVAVRHEDVAVDVYTAAVGAVHGGFGGRASVSLAAQPASGNCSDDSAIGVDHPDGVVLGVHHDHVVLGVAA